MNAHKPGPASRFGEAVSLIEIRCDCGRSFVHPTEAGALVYHAKHVADPDGVLWAARCGVSNDSTAGVQVPAEETPQ